MTSVSKQAMLCNEYMEGIHYGDQPVRILFQTIEEAFTHVKGVLAKHTNNPNLENVRLKILTENIKCIGPKCNPHSVSIHDTYLSFLWCLGYGLLKDFPRPAEQQMLNYSLHLLHDFREWDKSSLANPELYPKDNMVNIEKANFVFSYAIQFILYHELAHIALGHHSETKKSRIQMESEADHFACDVFMNLIENQIPEKRFPFYVAALLAVTSLLFTNYHLSGGDFHPDPHRRLEFFLNKMSDHENHELWWIEMVLLMNWGFWFNSGARLWPVTYSIGRSYKDTFYDVLRCLDYIQEERRHKVENFQKVFNKGDDVILLGTQRTVKIQLCLAEESDQFLYKVEHPSGEIQIVSSYDIAPIESEIAKKVKNWHEEMLSKNEESMSIGIDEKGELVCFFHTSGHYELINNHPEIKFKWTFGQPSYIRHDT